MNRIGEFLQLTGEFSDAVTHLGQRLFSALPFTLNGIAFSGCSLQRHLEPLKSGLPTRDNRRGQRGRAVSSASGLFGTCTRLPFVLGLPTQRISLHRNTAYPFFGRA